MEELVALSINAEDYDLLESWRLVSWCKNQGADEWTIAAITVEGAEMALFERFDELAKPFRLPQSNRRTLSVQHPLHDFIQPTELWRLSAASLAILRAVLPEGLFTYQFDKDGWFEDPIFYRRGELMLGVVSHENEGVVQITKTEQRLLEAEGFVFRLCESYVGY